MTDTEPRTAKKMKMDQGETNDCTSTCSLRPVPSLNSDLMRDANDALQESNRIHVRPVIDETKLGIELFVGDQKQQFHGLIKSRYADFIVHEIDLLGLEAKLTTLEPPEEQETLNSMNLGDFVKDDALDCLSEVNNGYLNEYKIDVTGMDKDSRTLLHHALRASFDRLESTTVSEFQHSKEELNGNNYSNQERDSMPDSTQQVDKTTEMNQIELKTNAEEKKYILVTRRNKISRPKNIWPRGRPDFTHFILYKENKDTMDAIHLLAGVTNTKPSSFGSAGVKDRRAVTSQWISCWRLEPKRILNAAKRFNKRPFIKVGNFCFKKEPIRLGNLSANKFDIVIRHLVHNSGGVKIIESAMESIKERGFINYFGLQRFGTRSIQTHQIGLAILQSKWDEAIDLILSYRYDDRNLQALPISQNKAIEGQNANDTDTVSSSPSAENQKLVRDRPENRRFNNGAADHNNFIDLWKSKGDADTVFKKYPQFKFTNEGHIMRALSRSSESRRDFLGAMTALPRTVRSMYVHSYQSFLWNKMVTFRLRRHGFTVIPGDLILSSDSDVSDNSLEILLVSDEVETSENSTPKDSTEEDQIINSGDKLKRAPIEDIDSKIIIATEENLKDYSIYDVVLPLLGSRVRLPQNDVGEEFLKILEEDNISLECFKAREKLFISYGSYRKMMVRPSNVQWSIKQYSDPQQNLVDTDLDQINRAMQSKNEDATSKPRSPPRSDSSDEALVVSFQLPPSSYATMCLREIMKTRHDLNNRF